MPVKNGVGYSEYTPTKQKIFSEFLKLQTSIAVGAIKNRKIPQTEQCYYYFDLNAGPGIFYGDKGSPLIFLDTIKHRNVKFNAVYIEKEDVNHTQLMENLTLYNDIPMNGCQYPICGDHNDIMDDWIDRIIKKGGNRFGLIYTDPSGVLPPFDLLSKIYKYKEFSRMDLLIHCSTTNIKRIFGERNKQCDSEEQKRLSKFLDSINKRHWLVSKPKGDSFNWSFLFGCNWAHFPDYAKIDFFKSDSKEGKKILYDINYTKEEKDK